MAVAHHSNYLAWFEVGRTDLCREAGISYQEIERQGYLLVVTDASCRYRIPFQYDEEVVVETSIVEMSSRSIRFRYLLRAPEETTARASGETKHLWLDKTTRRPVRAPESIAALFRPFL